MPASNVNPVTGAVSSFNPNLGGDAFLANILIEMRVQSAILLSLVQGQGVAESLEQLRQDVTTEIPNPPI